MSLAISGTNARENRLVFDKLIHKLLTVSRKCTNGRCWYTAGGEKKLMFLNHKITSAYICGAVLSNVPVTAPIFTYLLCRGLSQIRNNNSLKKAPWRSDKAKFCSAPLAVGGIHYQHNPTQQAISWKQFQHGQNGKCTDTSYFHWSWNQPGLTGY